jgi:hypothetical protein
VGCVLRSFSSRKGFQKRAPTLLQLGRDSAGLSAFRLVCCFAVRPAARRLAQIKQRNETAVKARAGDVTGMNSNREKTMHRYHLTVRTETAQYHYSALQRSAVEAMLDALDLFGLCAVSVRPC